MATPQRLILPMLMLMLVICSWLAPMDPLATQFVDAGLKRAAISFAAARALNAAISVAKGTEVSMQPAGVGATFAPGQVLDPIDDLIERFSELMLGAMVLFGVQKLLIGIGSYWPVSLALSTVALAWTWGWLSRKPSMPWLSRLLAILVMLRFAIPMVAIASDLVWQKFLAEDYLVSQRAIDTASSDAARSDTTKVELNDRGLVDKVKGWFGHVTDIRARFEDLKRSVEKVTEHVIRLMVAFVVQTLVIPGLMMWAMWAWLRGLFAPERA